MYELYYTNQAKKDYQKLKTSNLNEKILQLLDVIKNNPYKNPPPFEVLSARVQLKSTPTLKSSRMYVQKPRVLI